MTERHAMLASILHDPNDDTPRLIFADFLNENGEGEHAEFVRLGVELARTKCERPCTGIVKAAGGFGMHCSCHRKGLRDKIDKALAANVEWAEPVAKLWHPTPIANAHYGHSGCAIPGGTSIRNEDRSGPRWAWQRGFISRVTLDWQSWLAHGNRLTWWEGATDTCVRCRGDGKEPSDVWNAARTKLGRSCQQCSGTGRIPRPVTDASQPIEEVRLTTWARTGIFLSEDGPLIDRMVSDCGDYVFGRVKCKTCDGWGTTRAERRGKIGDTCPDCHGRPLNLWTCSAWPKVRFVMPIPIPGAVR